MTPSIDDTDPAAAIAEPPLSHGGQPVVYLAEDDDEIRETLASLLEYDGHCVRTASDGIQIFDWLFRDRLPAARLPDVIVTDHRMPGYSSLDILAALEELQWTIPVVVITAFGWEVRSLARAHGACAIFEKPFEPDALRLAVMHCINWRVRRVRPRPTDRVERVMVRRARSAMRADGHGGQG
jgi:DNA-binding NtrC family response regulator